MTNLIRLLAGTVVCVTGVSAAEPSAAASDKSIYTLFRPTPRELMRPMSTDRPDQTESPYTVDAGHLQLELDFLNYTYDHDGANAHSWSVMPFNFKVGLLNNVDLQLMFDPYVRQRFTDFSGGSPRKMTVDGIGDFQARLKVNLWGNDGGKTAFAIMPFIKAPTADRDLGNNAVEGGVILPLSIELCDRAGLGLMTEFDFMRNSFDNGYHADFINSITLATSITDSLGAYIEFFTVVSTERGSDWSGQFDLGLTYGIGDDIQLDGGINIGLTDNAPDLQPFVGISVRY